MKPIVKSAFTDCLSACRADGLEMFGLTLNRPLALTQRRLADFQAP